MSSDPTWVKVREGSSVWREMDGETVLLDLESSTYLGINAAGSFLWPPMVRGATRQELVQLLLDRFGLDQAQAERDVDAFVATCRSRGLLEDD